MTLLAKRPLLEESLEEKKNKKLFGNLKFFQKFKSVKHIEIIVAIILCAIVLLIYISTFKQSSSSQSFESTSTTEYAAMLENKLEQILQNIDGVGNVSVMITLSSGPEYVYATSDEEKTNTNEGNGSLTTSTTVTKEPIIVSNDIVIIKEIMPTVGGIVVVAGGAENTKVKLEIIKAIQALVDVPQANIEVLAGK